MSDIGKQAERRTPETENWTITSEATDDGSAINKDLAWLFHIALEDALLPQNTCEQRIVTGNLEFGLVRP